MLVIRGTAFLKKFLVALKSYLTTFNFGMNKVIAIIVFCSPGGGKGWRKKIRSKKVCRAKVLELRYL